jgi:hypothetical protein
LPGLRISAIIDSVKKRPTHLIVQNLEEEVVHEVLIPEKGKEIP